MVNDGSHLTLHILASLQTLWSRLSDKAVYAIEDFHTLTLFRGAKGMTVQGKDYDAVGAWPETCRRTSHTCPGPCAATSRRQ